MYQLLRADITTIECDAIVNAANTSLLGGGGVDGAIHRKGGSAILDECRAIRAKQGKCKVGEAVHTTAGDLPAKYVIHTVGPVWNGGTKNEAELLTNCYANSLRIAEELGCESIAFPCISTGIYRFPIAEAAKIAVSAVNFYYKNNPNTTIKSFSFVCFDQPNFEAYANTLIS
jgi:O-acetyl-ADP-ribose deacetylase